MLAPAVYAGRRSRLQRAVPAPILLLGNGERYRNSAYPFPFRQDSTFLYLTGCDLPGAAALLADGVSTLFLPPPAPDDALWHGQSETLEQTGARLGFDRVRPAAELEAACEPLRGDLRTLAVPDPAATALGARLTGRALAFRNGLGADDGRGDLELIDAIIAMRRILAPEEIAEMSRAAAVTEAAHRAAMAATVPGGHERQVAAVFNGVIAAHGMAPAYSSIVTVRGEVLHNFRPVNGLHEGELLLLDGAAESPAGYATDVTRTWPVSGRFDARQRAAYEAVLEAQRAAIDLVRPGARYRDVHERASLALAGFLADEGLLTCSPADAVETGAHALFFPHGVGHLIGLDVHDMEGFGDRAAYAPGRTRSPQFGAGYLRLDLDLEPGMAVTIEPGLYFAPAILSDPELTGRFARQVDFEKARSWLGFGGIRIEDDVVVTEADPYVVTGSTPKQVADVEAAVGIGSPWARFAS